MYQNVTEDLRTVANNVTAVNSSDLLPQNISNVLQWTSTTGFSLFILISVIITNSSVLYLFIQNTSLLTPFTVYVLNLLFANMLRTVLCYPLELINNLYNTWWTGWTSCTLSLYGTWIVEAAMCNSHMLIALNRMWAVTFPHSYRTRHTTRFAILTCMTMWTYVHTGLLPGVIMDALWYRKPLETDGCMLNTAAQLDWSQIIQTPYYALPYVVVILVYPIVCFKLWRTSRLRIGPALASATTQATSTQAAPSSHVHVTAGTQGNRAAPRSELTNVARVRREERKNSAFLILTMMTLTLLVCYGPSQVFYMAAVYWDWEIPGLFFVGSVFYELMAVLDPLLFALAVADLRRAFRKVYCCAT